MVKSREDLFQDIRQLAEQLDLKAEAEVHIGKRLWGADRRIDLVISDPATGERLGLECRFQGTKGTTYEKIPGTIDDIRAWPIRGLVVFAGDGIPDGYKAYLRSTGLAIDLEDLDPWLRLFFARDLG